MSLDQFLPPTSIAILGIAMSIARFENQRWIRARQSGLRGSNESVGLFVDITGFIALLYSLIFLIAYGWQFGWQPAVGLFALGLIASILWSLIFRDHIITWIAGTLAIWPLMLMLAKTISWFGILV